MVWLQRGRALLSAERLAVACALRHRGTLLQRGRALLSAESCAFVDLDRAVTKLLQRGRALLSAESRSVEEEEKRLEELQRGRALLSAESETFSAIRNDCVAASTGPRSFERGKDRRGGLSFPGSYRFNGAALFGARKAPMTWTSKARFEGFNGAALFGARKEQEPKAIALANKVLQRGRALLSAERGWSGMVNWPGTQTLQRGRALLSAERLTPPKR